MGFLKSTTFLRLTARYFSQSKGPVIMKYLNVAEKNDAAKNIASLLSRGNSTRREGLSNYNKIYEFDATVFGHPARMVMTSVSGHLLNYAFVATFKNWLSCNPVALFDAPIIKTCPQDYEKIKRTLEREIRSCQGLIIWTDCDREGENIGFEVIKVCTDLKPNIPVYRAKFSEITTASVFRALNTLGQPNKNVSDAVDVRQELDLRTGAAFTRLQTLRLQRVFPQKLADKLISYGSCQFPTLGFVVERYQAIEDFVPEPFWRIKMNHKIKDLTVDFTWKRERLFNKNACEALLDICQENPLATVEMVESKPKSKWRPLPLDTVELEKTVSRKLRINAKDTMKIAEKLYTQGFISYPRTETNIFPKELNLVPLVEQQTGDNRWGQFAQGILQNGGPNPRQGRKSDQAHPPIHPTKYSNTLTGNEQRIYEYIVRHFLACLSKDAVGHETVVHVDIAAEKFIAKGLFILEKNYLEVYIYEKWNAKEIHEYQNGDTFTPSELSLAEGSTTPPKLLTEADLITLMDKHGIGTDATHAEHIETIKSREYVGLHENIYFVPGTLGMGLVEGFVLSPKLLTEADLITLMDKHGIGTDAIHAEHIETIKSREYVGLHENIYFVPGTLGMGLVEGFVLSPKLLTEADLITLMDKHGIGTDAIRAEHIETIKSREYVGLHENIYFVPGTLGMGLVEGYNNIGLEVSLAKPNLRADFEKDLKLICDGHKSPDVVRREQIEKYKAVFTIVMDKMIEIDRTLGRRLDDQPQEVAENQVTNQDEFKPVLKCPKCGNNMIIRTRKTGTGKYLGCVGFPGCKNVVWLPQTIETIEILDEACRSCGPDVKKLKIKFKQNPFPGEPNPNTICIGGCDNIVLETLNINSGSVKKANNQNGPAIPVNNRTVPVIPNQQTLNNWINAGAATANPPQNRNTTTNRPGNGNNSNTRQFGTQNHFGGGGSGSGTSTNRRDDGDDGRGPNNNQRLPRSFLNSNIQATDMNTGNLVPVPNRITNNNNFGQASSSGNRTFNYNGPEDNVLCTCNNEAIQLTVRKEGPNTGRKFYKCQAGTTNGGCDFFLWADENPPATRPGPSVLKCDCNLPAAQRRVSKAGPNTGREFYCCPKPIGEGCRFFKWADEVPPGNSNNGGDDDDNDDGGWGSGGGASQRRGGNTSRWNGGTGSPWKKKKWKGKGKRKTKTMPYNKSKGSSQAGGSGRAARRCGICKEEGHTKNKCPNN